MHKSVSELESFRPQSVDQVQYFQAEKMSKESGDTLADMSAWCFDYKTSI